MKCIDAIEGTVKCILKKMHADHVENYSDDSDYIQTVKTVINATDNYIASNPECVENPDLLKQVLYDYSRELWMVAQDSTTGCVSVGNTRLGSDHDEYQTYYYDYLYDRGIYPS